MTDSNSSSIITEPDTIERLLLQYAADKKLSDIVLSTDGLTLIVNGNNNNNTNESTNTVVSATCKIRSEYDNKVCVYSSGSIYLQIIDPTQGLLSYRTVCKQNNVNDPVKALDKKIVISYFLGTTTSTSTSTESITTTTTTTTIIDPQQVQQQQGDATQTTTTILATGADPTTTVAVVDTGGVDDTDDIDNSKLKQQDSQSTSVIDKNKTDTKLDDRKQSSSSHREKDRTKDKESRRHDDRSSKREREKERESSSDRHKRKERERKSDAALLSSSSQKKQKKDIQLVSNEQLMDNLDVVVDKRQIVLTNDTTGTTTGSNNNEFSTTDNNNMDDNIHDIEYILMKRQQELIRKALSADGFRLQNLSTSTTTTSTTTTGDNTTTGGSGSATDTTTTDTTTGSNKDDKGGSSRTVITKEHKDRTAEILAYEIPVGNSASILRANNPKKDLSRVLELYLETINTSSNNKDNNNNKKGSNSNNNKGQSSSNGRPGSNSSSTGQRKAYLIGKKPVIVVPKGMTAPLTLINAYEFLCNAKFIPRDVMIKQQQQKSGKVVSDTSFVRNIAGIETSSSLSSSATTSASASALSSSQSSSSLSQNNNNTNNSNTNLLEYEITDNPRKLLGPDPKDWERIVAVIVLGQSWQFKDWYKTYSVPATLFTNVYGFFISMEGDKEPIDVCNWAVTRAYLNRDKRGLDRVTFASFWNRLDEWMRVYKPELLPSSQQD